MIWEIFKTRKCYVPPGPICFYDYIQLAIEYILQALSSLCYLKQEQLLSVMKK